MNRKIERRKKDLVSKRQIYRRVAESLKKGNEENNSTIL